MKKIFIVFSFLITLPAFSDFENMCGVNGYSVFNAVYAPYLPSEYDNGPFDADDTFTCAANTPRVLNATFEPETYVCAAGYYLSANTDGCAACTENSYCVGGTYSFNANTNQGITACSFGYGSPAGASACTPNTITIDWAGANGTYQTGSCTYDGAITTPTTPPTRRGYRFDGWTFVEQL